MADLDRTVHVDWDSDKTVQGTFDEHRHTQDDHYNTNTNKIPQTMLGKIRGGLFWQLAANEFG